MFPHTITIYHYEDEVYTSHVINGVYLYGSDGISLSGKGIASNHLKTVIIPKMALEDGLKIETNDKLVMGEGKDIETIRDLKDFITITKVSRNICNSDLDNIELGCE